MVCNCAVAAGNGTSSSRQPDSDGEDKVIHHFWNNSQDGGEDILQGRYPGRGGPPGRGSPGKGPPDGGSPNDDDDDDDDDGGPPLGQTFHQTCWQATHQKTIFGSSIHTVTSKPFPC